MFVYLEDIMLNINSDIDIYLNIDTGEYSADIDFRDNKESTFLLLPKIKRKDSYEAFVNQLPDRKLKRKFKNSLSDKNLKNLHNAFHVLLNNSSLVDDYIKFERKFTLKLAEEWCDKNNIKHTSKKNPARNFNYWN